MTAPEPASEAFVVFPVKEMLWLSQLPGKLFVFHDRLRVEIDGRPVCELSHAERCGQSELNLWPRTFTIHKPVKRSFSLDRDALRALQGWIGPPTPADLKLALNRGFAWAVPMGGLIVLFSLPMGEMPLDLTTCVEGMVLVFIALLSRVAPHRAFFLLESIWVLALAVTNALNALENSSYWWMILVVFVVLVVLHGIREFFRFAPERMAIANSPEI